jgi:hypothetical protein
MRPSGWLFCCAATVALRAQSPLFTTEAYELPPDQRPLFVFDADADGDLDLLVKQPQSITLVTTSLLWNEGDGRFGGRPPTDVSTTLGALTTGTAFGDFDGDGDLDVFGQLGPGSFGFRRNDGGGVFASPIATAPFAALTGATSVLAASGDLDGDGDADLLLAASSFAGPVANVVWLNVGPFAFVAAAPLGLPTGFVASTVFAANADALPDLLAVATAGGQTAAGAPYTYLPLVNQGGATFAAGVAASPPPEQTSSATRTVADFDGDLVDDVLYEKVNGAPGAVRYDLVLLRGDGAGSFAAPVVSPLAGGWVGNGATLRPLDVDGDGAPELVRAGFAGAASGVGPDAFRADVFAYVPGLGYPNPSLQTLPRVGRAFVADFDGDGDRDLLGTTAGDVMIGALYFANGTGTLAAHEAAPGLRIAGRPAALGDLNGDLSPEIFWRDPQSGSTAMIVARNDGGARFTTTDVANATPYSGPALVADWDRDGRDDLLLLVDGAADACAPGSDGPNGPFFGAPIPLGVDLPVSARVTRADVDGDGLVDLVFEPSAAATCVAVLCGGAAWSAPAPLGVAAAQSVAFGDFDGDGDLDLVKRPATGAFLLCARQPDGSYVETPLPPTITGAPIAAADFDLDGDADLLVGRNVYFSTPAGFVAGPVAPFSTAPTFVTTSLGAADLDDDGDFDAYADGGFCRWTGAGFGPFEALPQSPFAGSLSTGLLLRAPWTPRDMDRDGDLDAVDAFGGVYLNATRQLYGGLRARPGALASLVIRGVPGESVLVFGAPVALEPTYFEPYGYAIVDPFTAALVFGGILDASGRLEAAGFIANDPAFVGLKLFWQAGLFGQARVTGVAAVEILAL